MKVKLNRFSFVNNFKKKISTVRNGGSNKEIIILLIGAPGVGKGTYSKFMSKDLNLPVISSGDELRKYIKVSNDPFVEKIKKIMEEGQLVNDDYMLEFMLERLNKSEFKKGVILDGYPRRISQAKMLENYKKVDVVIKLALNEEILIKKLLGRRICVNCGKNYNVCTINENGYDMEPLLPKNDPTGKKCDECHNDLIQRQDDTEKIIRDRLNVYKDLTIPLENFYQEKNIMTEVELKRGIKDYPILRDIVFNKLKQSGLC